MWWEHWSLMDFFFRFKKFIASKLRLISFGVDTSMFMFIPSLKSWFISWRFLCQRGTEFEPDILYHCMYICSHKLAQFFGILSYMQNEFKAKSLTAWECLHLLRSYYPHSLRAYSKSKVKQLKLMFVLISWSAFM